MITIDLAKPEDLDELTLEAKLDEHPVCLPSYIVRKDNRISGYISFVTAMHGWLHTKRIRPIETFRTVFPTIDAMARANGDRHLFYLTGRESNLTPFAERIGFKHIGDTVLFGKQL